MLVKLACCLPGANLFRHFVAVAVLWKRGRQVKTRLFLIFHGVLSSERFLNITRMNINPDLFPESWIRAARSGSEDAVARLIEHYRPYLRMLAHVSINRHLQSKVDESDIVQEATLRASRDIAQFHGTTEQELAAWLRSVMTHVIANTYRHYSRRKRGVRFELQLKSELDQSSAGFARLVGNESSPSGRAIRREQAVLLATALERLPTQQRRVLMLREIDGMKLAEIADQMGRTRNSVQKLWARGIAELRRLLKDAK